MSKADTIRNKWQKKRKTRTVSHSEQEPKQEVKEVQIVVDEVDHVNAQPDVTDQVLKHDR